MLSCFRYISQVWRVGGAVERGGLENRCTRESTGGSNPSPSAFGSLSYHSIDGKLALVLNSTVCSTAYLQYLPPPK